MPKNEDGEFELILGNRQLLTVFFIVVVLFGVFFAMGYILGRNSGPLTPDVATAKKVEKPLVVDSPGRDGSPVPPAKTEPAPPTVEKPKPVEVAKAEPKAEPRKAEPPPKPEPKKADPPKVEAKKPEPAKPKPEPAKPAPTSSEPAPGSYLQLTATSQHEAALYVDVLKKKGFKAVAVQVPDNGSLFRVMVGPLTDGNLGKTKSDLKAAGFPGDRAIKRTF